MTKDKAFLKHILDEIDYLIATSEEQELREVIENPNLRRSFPRSLEVIGEAAKNLSHDLKKHHPEVEWGQIVGMRNKLIHYYFGVDWEIVWDVVKNELPTLKGQIEALLSETD